VAADYTSILRVTNDASIERFVLGGASPIDRPVPVPMSHVRRVATGALVVYRVVVAVLRVLVRALYLFPLLLVAKISLWATGSWYGDLLTVGFVCLVVAFFTVFALTMLMHVIVGPRSKRGNRTSFVFAPPRPRDVSRIASRLAPDAPTRIIGVLDAGLEPGAPVLVEEWSERDGGVERSFEGQSFVVLAEGGSPTVVELAAAPVLIAAYEEAGHARRCVLRQGDRVELIAAGAEPAARIEDSRLRALLDAASPVDPYRGAESTAILVRSTPEQPVVVAVVSLAAST